MQEENRALDQAEEAKPKTEHLDPNRRRTEGNVIECDGERAVIAAEVNDDIEYMENYWAVGQMLSIWVGKNRVIGQSYKVEVPDNSWSEEGSNLLHVHMELVGEVTSTPNGDKFSSGISTYPQMGCSAHRIRTTDLSAIYAATSDNLIRIGALTQDSSVPADIDLDKLLSRHFAVVGSTGVGKSTSVTLMLRKIVEQKPEMRVLMLDPHAEFASAFPNHSIVIDSTNLKLPFWMFKLDEFKEVVFRGQDGFDTEFELLRDLIPLAKERYKASKSAKGNTLVRKTTDKSRLSADTPIPYRMQDLMEIIDERLGLLDGKSEKPILKSLEAKLDSIMQDARFQFMFDMANGGGGDTMEEIVAQIFRVPQNDKPICVFELSGLPSEVVNSVASVLCRMAFDLALSSDGLIQTLVVCEEAHRYIPADLSTGFWPTRQAIARIAKEGRKYGVYLGIITQRPGELDPTILSQCNTIFAMRLGNQIDQTIIKGAVTNGAKSTISFLSSIANRECIAFGEALHTPMRLTFETMRKEDLPGSHIYENQEKAASGASVSLAAVIRKMRNEDHRSTSTEDGFDGNFGVGQAGDGISDDMLPVMDSPSELEAAASRGFALPEAESDSPPTASSETAGSSIPIVESEIVAPNPSEGATDAEQLKMAQKVRQEAREQASGAKPAVASRSSGFGQAAAPAAPDRQSDAPAAPREKGGVSSLISSFRSK